MALDEAAASTADVNQMNSLKRKRLSIPDQAGASHAKGTVSSKVQQPGGALPSTNEVLHSQVLTAGPSGAATVASKHARKTIENRRNSAISPKHGHESSVGKTIQTVSLVQTKSNVLEKTSQGG